MGFIFSNSYSQSDKNIFNAYYLAKELANQNNFSTSRKDSLANDSLMKKMLGGIFWYSSNDVDNINNLSSLMDVCKTDYPSLYKKINVINTALLKQFNVLNTETKNLTGTKIDNKILSELIDLQSRHTIAINNYKKLNETNPEEKLNSEKTKLVNLLQQITSKKDRLFELDQIWINDSSQSYRNYKEYKAILDSITRFTTDSFNIEKNKKAFLDSLTLLEQAANAIQSIVVEANQFSSSLTPEIRLKLAGKNPDTNYLMDATSLATITRSAFNDIYVSAKEDLEKDNTSTIAFSLPNQTQLIDAMAIYLVKRVKQESVLWFFETIRKNAKFYTLVSEVFPETITLLQGNEIYEAPKMGSLWRYAISKDFVTMPENFLKSNWLKNKGIISEESISDLKTALQIGRMFQQKYTYKQMINSLYSSIPYSYYLKNPDQDKVTLNTVISLLHAIQEEFVKVSGDKNKNFSSLQLSELLHMTNEEFEIMLSLIDLKYNHLIRKLMQETKLDIKENLTINTLKRWFGSIMSKLEQFETLSSDAVNLKKELEGLNGSTFEFSNSNNTWKLVADLMDIFNIDKEDPVVQKIFKGWEKSAIGKVVEKVSAIQEFFYMLDKKNFAGCVNVLFRTIDGYDKKDSIILSTEIVDELLTNYQFRHFNKLIGDYSNKAQQEKYSFTFIPTDNAVNKGRLVINPATPLGIAVRLKDDNAKNIIIKIAGFLNDVALTKSGKELAKTIEAYAMPAGSYKKKRESWFSFDLNAYVGLYAGNEWINRSNLKQQNRTGSVYGLTAPIGFSFSKTLGRRMNPSLFLENKENPDHIKFNKKQLWTLRPTTFTLFVSAIDIGAVVSYRFGNNDSILPQQVKLAQVFSPGVHLNIGLRNTPIVFAAGYQYSPSLRRINDATNSPSQTEWNTNRVYAGILFDIPLFNFFSTTTKNVIKPKKK